MPKAEWVALVFFVLSAVLLFPGELTTDSGDQLSEAMGAEITDWHSPLLTHVWRLLLMFGAGQGAMLVLQLACFWGGVLILAGSLARSGRPRASWAILAVALFPHFIFFNHYILKDTLHYSMMFLSVGLSSWGLLQRPSNRFWLFAGAFALLLACFVRVNAAFGAAPLTIGLFCAPARLRFVRFVLGVCIVSLLLIGAVRFLNASVLNAKESDVEQSVQLFDLAGIHYYSGDGGVWGGAPVSELDIRACYTSFYWDVFGIKGICGPMRAKLGADTNGAFDVAARMKRKTLWLRAIYEHPVAYFQHRASHFNSAIFFAVPALHVRFNKSIRDGSRAGRAAFTERDVWVDYVKKSILIWPVNWLVVGAGLLNLLWPAARADRDARLAVALATSGLAYGLAYAVVGVATDVRYFLWTNLAVMLAAVIGWPALRQCWDDSRQQCILWMLALGLTAAVGLASRLLAVQFV